MIAVLPTVLVVELGLDNFTIYYVYHVQNSM